MRISHVLCSKTAAKSVLMVAMLGLWMTEGQLLCRGAEAPDPSAVARVTCNRLRKAAAGKGPAHLGSAQRKHSLRRAKLLAPHDGQGQSPEGALSQSSPCNLVLLLTWFAHNFKRYKMGKVQGSQARHLEQEICKEKLTQTTQLASSVSALGRAHKGARGGTRLTWL